MRIFNKQIVDVGKLQGLEAANKRLQENNNLGSQQVQELCEDISKLRASLEIVNYNNTLYKARVEELEQTIADNKFLPNNKPNLELAAKTVADWGNNRTIVSFFKKVFMLVDDSCITTCDRYIKTEIKKRKLEINA